MHLALAVAVGLALGAAGGVDERANAVLMKKCGGCHVGSSPDKQEAALKVFDLLQPAWVAKLSRERLDKVIGRMKGKGDAEEVRIVTAFIQQEKLERRR